MRARGRVSVCNEMRVAIDKVAGANEQTEGEVRGWLMETRPKMGEKNCTRAVERGRAGRLWAAEMKRLHAGRQRARKRSERGRRVGRARARQQMDGERCAYETTTWYRHRLPVCVKSVRVWSRGAEESSRSRPLYVATPHTNG
jgi:hypothetical protein